MHIVVLLLVVAGIAAGAPVPGGSTPDPGSPAEPIEIAAPWWRLELARDLRDRDLVDEAAVVFLRLLDDPRAGATARDELLALATAGPARPGWRDIYDALRADEGLSEAVWASLTDRSELAAAAGPVAGPPPVPPEDLLAQGRVEEALAVQRRTLAQATADTFWTRLGTLAALHTQVAEHAKSEKRHDDGILHYRVAIALSPDTAGWYSGLAGMLWSVGRLDEGRDAYLAAIPLAPGDVNLVQHAVGISLAGKDLEGASQVLAQTSVVGPQIERLRLEVEVADVLARIDREGDAAARAALEELLQRYPDNTATLHALGDTLLRSGKPREALTTYQRARALRPDDPWLAMAEATCRIQLDDHETALAILADIGDDWDEDTSRALRSVRAWALRAEGQELWQEQGDPEAAFEVYADALALHAEPWSLVALGGLYLAHRQPSAALACFDEALGLDGASSAAALGRIHALLALDQRDDAQASLVALAHGDDADDLAAALEQDLVDQPWEALVDRFVAAMGDEAAPDRASLASALFAVRIERALQLGRDGHRRAAMRELDALGRAVESSVDAWSRLGGAWLALGSPGRAVQAYSRALTIDPDDATAVIGMASAFQARGELRRAARWLSRSFARTRDPRVGYASALLRGRLGRWRAGLDTLQTVRDTDGDALQPLPLVDLPSGRTLDDAPPSSYEGISGRASPAALALLEEDYRAPHAPYAHVTGGSYGRTGQTGEGLLDSQLAGVTLRDLRVGPLRVRLDALTVALGNGEQRAFGASPAIGVSTSDQARFGLDVQVGTSPIGFPAGVYVTWLGSARASLGPHLAIAADTGRVPVTDSLLSWAGTIADDPLGQASYGWFGGWWSLSLPRGLSAGARGRTGQLAAFGIEDTRRSELVGWLGHTFGTGALAVRLGGSGTWLSHGQQIEAFSRGSAGIFSPRTYAAGMLEGKLRWRATPKGATLCANGALGVQDLTGEPREPYFTPGFGAALAIGAGVAFPLTRDWRMGLDAQTQSVGRDWWQQTIVLRVGHVPRWTGHPAFSAPSEIHGTRLDSITACGDLAGVTAAR